MTCMSACMSLYIHCTPSQRYEPVHTLYYSISALTLNILYSLFHLIYKHIYKPIYLFDAGLSGCTRADTVNDLDDFNELVDAMDAMGEKKWV